MSIEDNTEYYERYYEPLFWDVDQSQRRYIGEKDDVTCRFCGRAKPEVTFRNVAHAIPEFLGNKNIIVRDECDACNTHFSNHLENHFDKLTKPQRVFAQIRGKVKVPSYKSRNKKARIDFMPGKGLKITDRVDSQIVSIDESSKTVTVNVEVEPYVPTAAYKCLVKMALSVIPRAELAHFEPTLRWLQETDHSIKLITAQKALVTFVPGPRPNPQPVVIVLRRKDVLDDAPYCVSVLAFGNFVYQIIVPSLVEIQSCGKTRVSVRRFPTPFDGDSPFGKPSMRVLDLTNHDAVTGSSISLTLHYESIEKLDDGVEIRLEAAPDGFTTTVHRALQHGPGHGHDLLLQKRQSLAIA